MQIFEFGGVCPSSPQVVQGSALSGKGSGDDCEGLGSHDSSSGALPPKTKAFQYQGRGGEGWGAVREPEKSASHYN